MKNTIGIGTGSVDSCIQKATRDIQNPSLIIYISNYDYCEVFSQKLVEKYPGVQVIGTIGTGAAIGVSNTENYIQVVAFYDDVKVECGVIENVSVCPILHMKELEQKMVRIGAASNDTVMIEFTNGNEEILVSSINSVLTKKGIQLIGGSVYPIPDGKVPGATYNGKFYPDCCVYALIKNLKGNIKVYKEDIYIKGDRTPHYATKVDTSTRTIYELDGVPATKVYSRETGVAEKDILDNIFNNPFGRVVGETVYGSALKDVGPKGEISCYKRINENDCVYILDLGDYDKIESDTRRMIKEKHPHYSLVFTVDCGYRYFMYLNMNYWSKYVADHGTLGCHFGVVAGGEQCNNQHVNHTMVCAVFE